MEEGIGGREESTENGEKGIGEGEWRNRGSGGERARGRAEEDHLRSIRDNITTTHEREGPKEKGKETKPINTNLRSFLPLPFPQPLSKTPEKRPKGRSYVMDLVSSPTMRAAFEATHQE